MAIASGTVPREISVRTKAGEVTEERCRIGRAMGGVIAGVPGEMVFGEIHGLIETLLPALATGRMRTGGLSRRNLER